MNILVLGSEGMLGRYVIEYLRDKNIVTEGFSRKDFDAKKTSNLRDLLKGYTHVINCIGIIRQRNISDSEMLIVNSIFPHVLATHCEYLNIKLIHISTDCVYDGKRGKYSEEDPATETELYGMSKAVGEPKNCCVIRTSIIGEEKHGKSLLEWVRSNKGKEIYGYTDHFWNGVTCLELAKIIFELIPDKLWMGVKHVHSPSVVNKYDLVKMISEEYNLNISVLEKQNGFIDKSLTSHDKLCKTSLSQQIKELRVWNPKKLNIFIITSIITASNKFITQEERYNQTLETIESIRKNTVNSYCILVEYSWKKLSESQRENLKRCVEDFIDATEHHVSSNKSLGDAYAWLLGLQRCKKLKKKNINSVTKISGRYTIGSNFDRSLFDHAKITFLYVPKGKCYVTVLFIVPIKLIDEMINYTQSVMQNIHPDIEHSYYRICTGNVNEVLSMDIHGFVAGAGYIFNGLTVNVEN